MEHLEDKHRIEGGKEKKNASNFFLLPDRTSPSTGLDRREKKKRISTFFDPSNYILAH